MSIVWSDLSARSDSKHCMFTRKRSISYQDSCRFSTFRQHFYVCVFVFFIDLQHPSLFTPQPQRLLPGCEKLASSQGSPEGRTIMGGCWAGNQTYAISMPGQLGVLCQDCQSRRSKSRIFFKQSCKCCLKVEKLFLFFLFFFIFKCSFKCALMAGELTVIIRR